MFLYFKNEKEIFMFRTYAKRFAPFSPTDKIEIEKTIKKTFQSFGVAVGIQENVYDDKEFLSYQIHLPYKGNVENNKTGLSMHPSVFFVEGGFLQFILSELNKSSLIKEYKAKAYTITTAREGTTKVPGSFFDIQSYDFLISMRSYKEEEYIEPKPYVPKYVQPYHIPQPEMVRGQNKSTRWDEETGQSISTLEYHTKFRKGKHITPEIDAMIDSTRLEYGTCQICSRVMKMFVSGTYADRWANQKGLLFKHKDTQDNVGSWCSGSEQLPYELSREVLKNYISKYKTGGIVKPVNPVRLRELEARYTSWRLKDPRTTSWNVSKAKQKKLYTLEEWSDRLEKTPVVKTPVVKTPVVKTPVVKTPVVKTPAVKKTPTVRLSPVETLFANSLSYLNADFDLDNLQPQEAIYVISELKPVTDKIPGSAKPAASKGGLPLLWVNKLIAELKELSKFYDLGDLEGDEVKVVMSSLKPILDKMPVVFTDKKASYGRYWF
jgi:hypothetical protein